VVLNRVPLTAVLSESIDEARQCGTRVLFDVDDLIFDAKVVAGLEFVRQRVPEDQARLLDAVRGIAATMERCGEGFCATLALREVIAQHRARVVLNGVCEETVRVSEAALREKERKGSAVRIGYPGGHPGHTFNLRVAEEPLDEMMENERNVVLVVIGPVELPPRLMRWEDRIERVPYVDWRRLPFELARLDVCIAPLADNPFNRCKSDIKFLEAAVVGVPLVASKVGQLGDTVRHGRNGLLAGTAEEWNEALTTLIGNPEWRRELAETAREQVLRERTSAALAPRLVEALLGQAEGAETPRARSSDLPPAPRTGIGRV
jgi:O-antigen biosynthesis protein